MKLSGSKIFHLLISKLLEDHPEALAFGRTKASKQVVPSQSPNEADISVVSFALPALFFWPVLTGVVIFIPLLLLLRLQQVSVFISFYSSLSF